MSARELVIGLIRSIRRSVAETVFKSIETLSRIDSIRLLILGYLSYVVIGWAVLCLPICHQVAGLRALDHLFISASAVSTTGLAPISTSDSYNWLGEFVVMMLIQFGGLGYMTISSFTILAVAGDISPLRERLSQTTLTLPEGFEVRGFLRIVFWFTIVIEGLGRWHCTLHLPHTMHRNPFGKRSSTV